MVREQAVYDHCVDSDNDGRGSNDVDAQPEDGDAFMFGKGVVEGVVVEREGLVERFDLVDDCEGYDENAAGGRLAGVSLERGGVA